MSGLVEPRGPTTSGSTLPRGTATSLTWSVHLSKKFVFLPTKVGVLLGYLLHHTRGKAVKVDPVVNLVLWQVNKFEVKVKVLKKISFLASFAVVYGLHDLRSGGQTTLFMATAYNALQVRNSTTPK